MSKSEEAIPSVFSAHFSPLPGFELLKFKQDNGIPVSDKEKSEYNDNLGEQGKLMLIEIREEQELIRVELENVRKLHKSMTDKTQRQINLSESIQLSRKLTALHQKEASMVEEICRLELELSDSFYD